MPKSTTKSAAKAAAKLAKSAAKAAAKPAKSTKAKASAKARPKTQPQRDHEDAAKNAGGREDAENAPPSAEPTMGKPSKNHPVEKAKVEARKHGEEHLRDVVGDGTNMTATQKKAVQDQKDEIALEKQAPAEPARGVEHSVGTERKEGIRTAPEESAR